MIKEAFGTGATIEEAKNNALAALNANEDEIIKFDVISQPKEKFLGLFGGSLAKVRAYYEFFDKEEEAKNTFDKVESYIKNILSSLGVENAEMTFDADDEEVRISIVCGDEYGSVIGRRGETLDAIQYLARLVINKGAKDYKRVSINVGDYREKRENTLRALARKNAAKVRKYGRSVVLDPMNPYERRIIHTTIQEIEGVTSHSVGNDDARKVVITLEDGFKPTSPYKDNGRGRKGGYNKGGYNKGRSNGGKRYYDAPKTDAPTRAPRSDSEGIRYGKIEINKD